MAELLARSRRIAARYIRASPAVDADDITSDAAYGVAVALHTYDPTRGPTLESHLFRRVVGAILDGLRRRGRIPNSDGQYKADAMTGAASLEDEAAGLSYGDRTADPNNHVDDLLERLVVDDRRQWLADALEVLTPRQRTIVETVLAGSSHTETAAACGVAAGSVHITMHRAKKALRRQAELDGLLDEAA